MSFDSRLFLKFVFFQYRSQNLRIFSIFLEDGLFLKMKLHLCHKDVIIVFPEPSTHGQFSLTSMGRENAFRINQKHYFYILQCKSRINWFYTAPSFKRKRTVIIIITSTAVLSYDRSPCRVKHEHIFMNCGHSYNF